MYRSAIATIVVGAALLITLTACAVGTVADPSGTSTPRPSLQATTPGPIPTSSGIAVELPTAKWNGIIADLSTRGVTGAAPQIVSAAAVTWQDGALGCPKPGQSYTQMLVDGMQVVIAVDGTNYDYRFGADDTPVLCQP